LARAAGGVNLWDTRRLEFRILGPLEVVDGGRTLDVGGQKQRVLLASLLLEANHVVSSDRLIDALWDDEPPPTALKALQVYVSQLRKVVGRDRIDTVAPGYRIAVGPDELDVARFAALAEAGRPEEALSLWRGPALAEFAYRRFAAGETARLEELRLVCIEERIDGDLERARHAELVGELEQLVREHPLRERLRAQLILALYRCGRQAEALDAYGAARTMLVDELGIEPGKRLRDLQHAILTQDAALDAPAAPAFAEAPPAEVVDEERRVRETRKTVTVVAVGVAASDETGEPLDPEALVRLAGRWHSAAEAAVLRHGGVLESAGAETLTAVFGFPAVHEDEALRALRAAVEIRDAVVGLAGEVAALEVDVHAGIGIGTGEVVTHGPTPAGLSGAPLTRAMRLQLAAGDGDVLLDEATSRLVRDAAALEVTAGGFRLARLDDLAGRRGSRFSSPMIGRGRERRRLLDAFEQAVTDRSCQLVTVLGAAGVGKSRLVQELLDAVGGSALVASGRCLPYGDGITFWPLHEALTEAAGLVDGNSAESSRVRLAGLLSGEQDGELFPAVRMFFEELARRQPLVLVFDDIHWAEPTFLDLVDHLADVSRGVPLLIVCVARPELLERRPAWGGGKLNAVSMLLEPLSGHECVQLIEAVIGEPGLASEVADRIAGASEGIPLFVEEMLSMLIDDGLLVRGSSEWNAVADLASVPVPPTIQALLAARLEQLDENERAFLECAAVIGKVFVEDALRELADPELRDALAGSLEALVRKDLIRADPPRANEQSFRFRHLLIRDAAYSSIPKESRWKLHVQCARWFEQAGGRAIETEELVGYHLEQAYRYLAEVGAVDDAAAAIGREAAALLGLAGRRAFARSDRHAGLNLMSRAVALLPPTDPLLLELVPSVRVVQGAPGQLEWADRVLTDAVEAAATSGDRTLAAHALVLRGLLRLFTDADVAPRDLVLAAERAVPVFEAGGDELGLARAWRLVAQAHYLDRSASRCGEASERALVHARRLHDPFEEREVGEWLAVALFAGPMPASEAQDRALRLAESSTDPILQACAYGCAGLLAAMQLRTDEAAACLARGAELRDGSGDAVPMYSLSAGYVHLWRGEAEAADSELRPRYERLRRVGEGAHFSTVVGLLASAEYELGRFDEAERLTRECEEVSRRNDVVSRLLWRSVRAKVLVRLGEADAAVELAEAAAAEAALGDFVLAQTETLLDLGEVLALTGAVEAAREAVEEAIRRCRRKENELGAGRGRKQLVQLPAR